MDVVELFVVSAFTLLCLAICMQHTVHGSTVSQCHVSGSELDEAKVATVVEILTQLTADVEKVDLSFVKVSVHVNAE